VYALSQPPSVAVENITLSAHRRKTVVGNPGPGLDRPVPRRFAAPEARWKFAGGQTTGYLIESKSKALEGL